MNAENRELLEEVVKNRLEAALDSGVEPEEAKRLFDEAMKAVDRQIESDKLDISYSEHIEKLESEKEKDIRDDEFRREEAKKDKLIRIGEFAAMLILAPVIETACKKVYAKLVCNFEKNYTFTTTAGRGLSSLFRFKK